MEAIKLKDFSSGEIAGAVGVSVRSVQRWSNPEEIHPNNENLDRLLDLALEVAPLESMRILAGEVMEFSRLVGKRCNMQQS